MEMDASRVKENIKIFILCLVIAGVWLLFSVPVVVYHVGDNEVANQYIISIH